MDMTEPPSGLLEADDALEWASENLELIGMGTAARIFVHPANPALVVRISDYPDGWFLYAESLLNDPETHRFAPAVCWLGEKNGYLIGVSERLSAGIDEVSEARIRHASSLVCDNASDEMLDAFDPGLSYFRRVLPQKIDGNEGNVLLRGDQIVFNDPLSSIPWEMEAGLRERLRIRPNPSPSGSRCP